MIHANCHDIFIAHTSMNFCVVACGGSPGARLHVTCHVGKKSWEVFAPEEEEVVFSCCYRCGGEVGEERSDRTHYKVRLLGV